MAHGFQPLSHANKEVVLATDFNRTGDRLATGSADHRIRVFEQEDGDWSLLEEWRAHHAAVTDLKFYPLPHPQIIASISEDIRFKVWLEDLANVPLSGRRFHCIFSQSPTNPTPYSSLAFHSPSSAGGTIYLALVTRDGLLSLSEPASPDSAIPNDWKEIDSFFLCEGPIARGIETSFRLSFQEADRPNYHAVAAGVDSQALSLVASALDIAKVYRIAPQSGWSAAEGGVATVAESYRFTAPVTELGGARGLIRDVAWCGASFGRTDLIATASADGWVRIYEVWVPKRDRGAGGGDGQDRGNKLNVGVRKATGPPSGIGAGLAGVERNAGEADESFVGHESKLMVELRHDGVWRVEWIRGGTLLLSAADTGRARVWALGKDEKWLEFADFGPDSQEDD